MYKIVKNSCASFFISIVFVFLLVTSAYSATWQDEVACGDEYINKPVRIVYDLKTVFSGYEDNIAFYPNDGVKTYKVRSTGTAYTRVSMNYIGNSEGKVSVYYTTGVAPAPVEFIECASIPNDNSSYVSLLLGSFVGLCFCLAYNARFF